MSNADPSWEKLVFAARLFRDVELAADDLAALDILRQRTVVAKRERLFGGVVEAAAFLAGPHASTLLAHSDSASVLARHALGLEALESARQKARNFLALGPA